MIMLPMDKVYANQIICVKMSVSVKNLLIYGSESEMLLRQITESDNDGSRKNFGDSGVEVHVLDQDIQYSIVEK